MTLQIVKNEKGEYTTHIDNKYNSSTWTHPEITIKLEIKDSEGNKTEFTDKNGNFNLGKDLTKGTYEATHFYFSSNQMLIDSKQN